MARKALILVDFQKEWTDTNSDYYVGDITLAIIKTNMLIDLCRSKGMKIIFVRHIEENSDGAFAKNSPNIEIIENINKNAEDLVINKNKISAFYKTDLEKELKSIDEIIICGILANLCVRSLIQDAYDRDFLITVIKDCCVSFDKKTQNFTFNDLKNTREEIQFMGFDEFKSKL